MSWNYLVAAPGVDIQLGADGGRLLLGPPGQIAGQMTRTDMVNRTLMLLREPGPDTGQPVPTTGDFTGPVIERDLNIALGQFISQTGLAPKVSERRDSFPVFPVLDYPVPPSLQAISRVEYTPSGQQTYKLVGMSFEEFDSLVGDVLPNDTGQPYYYRQMFAGYIRLQPKPGLGQFLGPGIGLFQFTGSPTAGQQISVALQNPPNVPITTATYTVLSTDTLSTVAFQVSNLIGTSSACVGINAFLQVPSVSSNQVQLTSINPPGSQITFDVNVTGSTMVVMPSGVVNLAPNGDRITFYYTSTGKTMLLPGDTPGIPPQYHMAIVYRVLMDYWRVKQDLSMAKDYERMYKDAVREARGLEWDAERSIQPTIAGDDDSGIVQSFGGGW